MDKLKKEKRGKNVQFHEMGLHEVRFKIKYEVCGKNREIELDEYELISGTICKFDLIYKLNVQAKC